MGDTKNTSGPGKRFIELPYWSRNAKAPTTEAFEKCLEQFLHEVDKNKSLQISNERTDVIYLVLDGWLSTSKFTEDGQQQIIDFVLPGEVFDPGSATRKMP